MSIRRGTYRVDRGSTSIEKDPKRIGKGEKQEQASTSPV